MDFWFDDGVIEDFTKSYPMLKELGYTGIVSILTEKVGAEGYLGIKELLVLIGEGWKVASHGTDHRLMIGMNLADTEKFLKDSKEWIIKNLGIEPHAFVPPWNAIRPEQKTLALAYYSYVRPPHNLHFHSKNFEDVKRTIKKYLSTPCLERGNIRRQRFESTKKYLIKHFNFYIENPK